MDFYPRSPCGERLIISPHSAPDSGISIHALLAESDDIRHTTTTRPSIFLSTLSLRRATLRVVDGSKSSIISIHALLAESDQANAVDQILPGHISIHALLAESDKMEFDRATSRITFLSTLSLRRAT